MTRAGNDSDWQGIATGTSHTCGIASGGGLRCFGLNDRGQLGLGSTAQVLVPTSVFAEQPYSRVSAGTGTCVSDGALVTCFGGNRSGELGAGIPSRRMTFEAAGQHGGMVRTAAFGQGHGCFVRVDGTLWCTGLGASGQLGLGDTASRQVFTQVGAANDWQAVSAGQSHSCGLRAGGRAFCWGGNGSGQLGDGTTATRLQPTELASEWELITTGVNHTCGIQADGSLWCWGNNANGQLGDGTTSARSLPVRVGGGYRAVAPGDGHTCALTLAGAVDCFGFNTYGALGNGTSVPSLVPVRAAQGMIALAAGASTTCAIDGVGALWCWGLSHLGQAASTNVSVLSPRLVAGGGTWSQIAASNFHTCGVRDGAVYCFGSNAGGQLGDGTFTRRTAPALSASLSPIMLALGFETTCLVGQDGTLRCAGTGGDGQLGDARAWAATARAGSCVGTGHGCAANAGCVDEASTAVCLCEPGRVGDGRAAGSGCDLDECQLANGGCALNASCTNTPGSRTCTCNPGYTGDGMECAEVNECALNNGGCHGNAACTNTPGSWSCACNPGYTGDGQVCSDINECLTNNGGCSPQAYCQNTSGGRTCRCPRGYTGDGITCTDVDECASGSSFCWVGLSCINRPGYYTCECVAEAEVCNNVDDDCNGITDDNPAPCPASPSGQSACVGGVCAIVTCPQGLADCDYATANGCEVDLLADSQNCGACGRACAPGVPCEAGACDCTPLTCGDLGLTMGPAQDGCGGTLWCGDPLPHIAAGDRFTCGVANERALCWGASEGRFMTVFEYRGALGLPPDSPLAVSEHLGPTIVPGLGGVRSVVAGAGHACALLADGRVGCWGNAWGNVPEASHYTSRPVGGIRTAVKLAAGAFHTCALLADRTISCWGLNYVGVVGDPSQTNHPLPYPVPGLPPVVDVSAGAFHTCALAADGRVFCWGSWASNSSMPPVEIPVLSAVRRLGSSSPTGRGSCAVHVDGSVSCWGTNDTSPVQTISGLAPTSAISSGQGFACALHLDASVSCWAEPTLWGFAPATIPLLSESSPSGIPGLEGVTEIAAGSEHACALLADGTARCWGSNADGQGGNLTRWTDYLAAVPVAEFPCGGDGPNRCNSTCIPTTCTALGAALGSFSDGCGGTLLCGDAHRPVLSGNRSMQCAVRPAGTVRCWGFSENGLGDGISQSSVSPVMVAGIGDAVSVQVGGGHACALTSGGGVWCWGANDYGQLGDGTTDPSDTPLLVTGVPSAVGIALGDSQSCALIADGAVHCWGDLGDGVPHPWPSPYLGFERAVLLRAGGNTVCAILENGSASCWGTVPMASPFFELVPRTLPGVDNAISLAVGRNGSTCVVNVTGEVSCSILGDYQRGGYPPSRLALPTAGIEVSLGASRICVRQEGGAASCMAFDLLWGLPWWGPVLDPAVLTENVASVSAGMFHRCASMNDGRVLCWGRNDYGQLGDGTFTDSTVPVEVLGL